jgi:CBS domain-containing protein
MRESLDPTVVAASELPVASFAGGAVEWIEPGASVVEAAQRLSQHSIGALVVGDGAEPIGIFTERDVVGAVAADRPLGALTVRDVMSTDLRWCDIDATVGEVAQEMMTHYVRHLLLEEAGEPAGIVSMRDLLGALIMPDDAP